MRRGLLVLALAAAAGCSSGTSCDALPGLQAQRDAARQAHATLLQGTPPPEQVAMSDDALHAVERRAYDLEQSCR